MCKVRKYKATSNVRVDKCMRKFVDWLHLFGVPIVACCCGHKKYPMTIILKVVVNGKEIFREMFTDIDIPRKRNFYKRDKVGYYFIPEVIQSKEGICECGHTQWSEHKSSFYEKNKDLKMVAQECNVKGCKCKKFKIRKKGGHFSSQS